MKTHKKQSMKTPRKEQACSTAKHISAKEDAQFARPPREDDDGYDPWSDRPARPEALFQADPWQ